jgi:hypothetical protein
MTKIYILSFVFAAALTSLSAQSTERIESKPKLVVVATQGKSFNDIKSSGVNGVIYFIDGVRTESALDFYNIKSEDVYSIEILNDQAEISKRYARKGEKLKSVIVVETVKRDRPTETVVSDKAGKAKN